MNSARTLHLLATALLGVACSCASAAESDARSPNIGLQTRATQAAQLGSNDAKDAPPGQLWYTGVRLGTNSKIGLTPNAQPPESWMLAGGYKWKDGQSLSMSSVQQKDMPSLKSQVQLVYRANAWGSGQMSLGLTNKTRAPLSANTLNPGLSLGYEWTSMSLRLSYDPWAPDTNNSALRLSVSGKFAF